MSPPIRTPKDLTIQPRDLSFGGGAPRPRWWLGGDPVATAYFDALSATFPNGERFFMDAVRRYSEGASPVLKDQIAAFLAQEAMHTREHVVFNRRIAGHGYAIEAMEARSAAVLADARTRPPLVQLAATAALEHFTAILANALLSDPRHLAGAPEEDKAMWRWHAIEEIEHKAVAYDTLILATQGLSPLGRWALRSSVMLAATALLVSTVGRNIADSFAADRINRPATWARLFRYLLIRPGVLRQVAGSYLAFFAPGFHPWKQDNRDLAARAVGSLGAGYGAGAAV